MADLGNGATATFGTSGFSFAIESISFGQKTREKIEKSHLGTTGEKEYTFNDLQDAADVTFRYQFDATAGVVNTNATPETVTVTWPIHTSGNTTNATYAGTGAITAVTPPTLENGVLQTAELTVTWDGNTGPAFTNEAA